jgi:hypothetical protein
MRRRTITMLAVGVAVLAAAAVAAAATVVVKPGHMGGWSIVNDTCGGASTESVGFVNGPGSPPAGSGSAKYTVGSNGDSYSTLRSGAYKGVKLSSLTALDYWTYVSQAPGSQAVYIDLYVSSTGGTTQDTTLTFEPVYNGTVTPNTWQHWDALHGLWWSDVKGGPPPLFTLASYIADNPNATIVGSDGFVLAAGCGGSAWTNFVGNADALTIGVSGTSTTYNFEASAAAKEHKVAICHKGHTIHVDQHAVPAHKRHGDTVGAC